MTDTTTEVATPQAGTLALPPEPGPISPSPDGKTLAYLQPDTGGQLHLWLCPVAEGEPRQVSLSFKLWSAPLEAPSWAPDGARLAVTGEHPDGGRPAIWLVEIESGESRVLIDHAASDINPRWSPDGTRIAFVSRREGRQAICLTFADHEEPVTALTDGTADDNEPTWSHDSSLIAFCRRIEGTVDDSHIWLVDLTDGSSRQLTDGPSAPRRQPRFAPDRQVVAYVTEEQNWADIGNVNADTGGSWIVAGEDGDKADPCWAPDGNRLLYTRTDGPYVACCVRGLSWTNPDVLDPGRGVARSPRWLGEQEVVYSFATTQEPAKFIVQAPQTDAERRELPRSRPWSAAEQPLVEGFVRDFEAGAGPRLSGLFYRQSETVGTAAGVVLVDDAPLTMRDARPHIEEQVLAQSGFAVFAPGLHGSEGLGREVSEGLRDHAESEVEVADLADAAATLRGITGVDQDHLAIVGRGYGGTLALLAAGGRPGTYQAVVAIDPITDWPRELDVASAAWRRWLLRQLGLPHARRAVYALRTPGTFAAVIDVPLLLITTGAASPQRAAQLESFRATLDEQGVAYEHQPVGDEPVAATFARIAAFLQQQLYPPPAPKPAPEPAPEPEVAPAGEEAAAVAGVGVAPAEAPATPGPTEEALVIAPAKKPSTKKSKAKKPAPEMAEPVAPPTPHEPEATRADEV